MSFATDISAFVKKTNIKADIVLRKIAFDCFNGVITMSPVDTGRFRGSWNISINSPNLSVLPEIFTKSPISAGSPLTDQQARGWNLEGVLSGITFGQTIYITNNLPYAVALENGWSKQAPHGVMRVTFERVKRDVASMVKLVTA